MCYYEKIMNIIFFIRHEVYRMTIPSSYIGHKDFLDKGIVKEFYPLDKKENAEKCRLSLFIKNYGNIIIFKNNYIDYIQ